MKALKCKGRASITSRLRIDVSCKLRPISRIRGRACALAVARRFLCGGSARPEAQGRASVLSISTIKIIGICRHLSLRFRRQTRSGSVRRSVCIYMKLTVQTFLTLDGVMQAPGGPEEDPSDAFTHGGWQAPFPDPAVGEFVTELNSHAGAFLFGRRTFDIFPSHWPDQTDPADPIASAINSRPKYVVSNSLSEADAAWRGEHPDTAHLVAGDVIATVQGLKDEPGDELQIWGSGKLLQTLLQHELVDRFRLVTYPLVLGSGRRLFNDGILPATMRPVDLTTTDLGIVIGTYEPAGPVGRGQM